MQSFIRYKIIFTLIFLIYPAYASLSNPLNEQKLYESYKVGDMNQWVKIIDNLTLEYKRTSNISTLYFLTQTQYGYIGYLLGINDKKLARKYLAEAEANIEKVLTAQPKNADAVALKAAFVAYHISLSPYKAPILGPRSMSLISDALELNPNSIQAIIEKGNAAHYAPSMFGGNPQEAVTYYLKAITIFENQNGGVPPKSWVYLNVYAQLALAYEKSKQLDRASATYKRILVIAPDFKWVKDELYPAFKRKNNL
jgi:tetratricopeptide (TPR) repeat protein